MATIEHIYMVVAIIILTTM